ncbi:MAG TPA: hypothetical protein VGN88_02890 [Phycisphaerae bacterium]
MHRNLSFVLSLLAILTAVSLLSRAQSQLPPVNSNSEEKEALTLAAGEYIKMYGFTQDAREGPAATKIVIGYDIENFAHTGDSIWEVRYLKEGNVPGPAGVRAVIWTNPASKKAIFICGMGAEENAEHAGSKDLVKSWYEKNIAKMNPDFTFEVSDFQLDFDVADFAVSGTKICEVRIITNNRLRGIVWVNPQKSTLRTIIGPWQKAPTAEK